MKGRVILSGKSLTDLVNALDVQTYSDTLEYSATGSNYKNVATSGIDVADIGKYFCLVHSTAPIGIYASVINLGGAAVLQVRTDNRESETADAASFTVAVIRLIP